MLYLQLAHLAQSHGQRRRAMLRARATAKAAGAQLVLRRPSAPVQWLLVLTKTDHLFPVETSPRPV